MELARGIIDYAEQDNAKEMRDAFYAALQDRVMHHIESHKQEMARTIFSQPEEVESDEESTSEE